MCSWSQKVEKLRNKAVQQLLLMKYTKIIMPQIISLLNSIKIIFFLILEMVKPVPGKYNYMYLLLSRLKHCDHVPIMTGRSI